MCDKAQATKSNDSCRWGLMRIEDMVCENNEEDDVMPIITIADFQINAAFEEISVVITEEDK